jgi:hypothetical protein
MTELEDLLIHEARQRLAKLGYAPAHDACAMCLHDRWEHNHGEECTRCECEQWTGRHP